MRKYFIFLILALFLAGCGSSTTSVKTAPQFQELSYSQGNNEINVTGYLEETNSQFTNVLFKDINVNLNDDNCNMVSASVTPTSVNNKQPFIINIKTDKACTNPTLNLQATENATYVDTNLKTITSPVNIDYNLLTGNNANTTADNTYKIYLQPNNITLTQGASQTFSISVFDQNNTPENNVTVTIDPPVNNGQIYGSFNTYSLTTNENGEAQFTYTAPSVINSDTQLNIPIHVASQTILLNILLKSSTQQTGASKIILIPSSLMLSSNTSYPINIITLDSNNRPVSTTVQISYPIDSQNHIYGNFNTYQITTNDNGEGNVTFTSTSDISNLNDLNVTFTDLYTQTTANLALLANQLNTTEKYEIDASVPTSTEIEKTFTLSITIKDNNGNIVSANDIKAEFENKLISFDDKTYVKDIQNKSSVSYDCIAGKYSGIEILKITATINGQTITQEIPITVQAGPISAISINYIGTTYDSTTGLFESTYSVHAVDKYSNPAKPGSQIQVGAVVNYKVAGNNGSLFNENNVTVFEDNSTNFANIVYPEDTLITFASEIHNNPVYLGGWIVENLENNNSIILSNEYTGNKVDGLSYVIGNERKYDKCDETIKVADFDHQDKTYVLDDTGTALLTLRFDPFLIGHTLGLFVNSYQDNRVGGSIKQILLGTNSDFIYYNDQTGSSSYWSFYSQTGDNVNGMFILGSDGGPYHHENICPTTTCTLAKDVKVKLEITTPKVCTFKSNNLDTLETRTDCNGEVQFEVHYDTNNTCEVHLIPEKDF